MTVYGFSQNDVDRIRVMLDVFEGGGTRRDRRGTRTWPTPSQKVFGRLSGQVAAATTLTGAPTTGTLQIYKFTSTGGTSDTGDTIGVYNFSVTAVTTDRWVMASCEVYSAKWLIDYMACS